MASDQITTINPATGEEIAHYDPMTADDIEAVLVQVTAAQRAWAATGIGDRASILRRAAEVLRERSADLAAVATTEMGKPLTESMAEVEKCAWVCEYYAQNSPEVLADQPVEASGTRSWVRHEPMGRCSRSCRGTSPTGRCSASQRPR